MFAKQAPHLYTISAVCNGIRVEASSHSMAQAGKRVVELYSVNRKHTDIGTLGLKRAVDSLVRYWCTSGRPEGVRMRMTHTCPVTIQMTRV